jgi:hypothetical protein
MTAPGLPSSKYHFIARLFELMNTISEDQLLIILKQLLKDKLSTHIFKLVIDLPDEQQTALLEKWTIPSKTVNSKVTSLTSIHTAHLSKPMIISLAVKRSS